MKTSVTVAAATATLGLAAVAQIASAPAHMLMGVLGAVFSVYLLPIVTDGERYEREKRFAYYGIAAITSLLIWLQGATPPQIGEPYVDAALVSLWGVESDIRCFIAGAALPFAAGAWQNRRQLLDALNRLKS